MEILTISLLIGLILNAPLLIVIAISRVETMFDLCIEEKEDLKIFCKSVAIYIIATISAYGLTVIIIFFLLKFLSAGI